MNNRKILSTTLLCTLLALSSCIQIGASAKPALKKTTSTTSSKPSQLTRTNSTRQRSTTQTPQSRISSSASINFDSLEDSTPTPKANSNNQQQQRPSTPIAKPVEYATADLLLNPTDQNLAPAEQVTTPLFTRLGQRANSPQRPLSKLQKSELDLEQELNSTLRRQNISELKSADDIALITDDTTRGYLRSQTPTTLATLLTSAPQQAHDGSQITRSKVWSAITTNIADSLGITSANKFISAHIKNISDSASKALDTILGDRSINNNIKQTRVNQLMSNTATSLKNLQRNVVTTLQDVPTNISDILSGSSTTIHRDSQGVMIGKSVEKFDDSTINYRYNNGKITAKVKTSYAENDDNPDILDIESREETLYNTAGKINAIKTTHIAGKFGNNAMDEQYNYDAQGRLDNKKITYLNKQQTAKGRTTSNLLKTETISYEKDQPISSLLYWTDDNDTMNYRYDKSSSKANPQTLFVSSYAKIPARLKTAEPVIDQKTGDLLGWNGLIATDAYGSIEQVTSPQGALSLTRYDKNKNLIYKAELSPKTMHTIRTTAKDGFSAETSPELQRFIDRFNLVDKSYQRDITAVGQPTFPRDNNNSVASTRNATLNLQNPTTLSNQLQTMFT